MYIACICIHCVNTALTFPAKFMFKNLVPSPRSLNPAHLSISWSHRRAFGPIMRRPPIGVCLATLALAVSSASAYCTPSDACWPTATAWQSLNASLSGGLIAITPELATCFGSAGSSSSPSCLSARASFSDPFYRASSPGLLLNSYFEIDPVAGGCVDALAATCAQGAVPPYGVAVGQPADVSVALQWAAAVNVAVVIKSSGDDYIGRSGAANALLIWLKPYKAISLALAFSACPGSIPAVSALTVQSGASWADVYAYLNTSTANASIVGSFGTSGSAVGGFVSGGGHSFASPAYGLAVDNLLQFTAVLTNGSIVTASPCAAPDLFWALRGGGGGSFAVVMDATYVLHPPPITGVAGYALALTLNNNASSLRLLLGSLLAVVPDWTSSGPSYAGGNANAAGAVAGGYFTATVPPNGSSSSSTGLFTLLLAVNSSVADATALVAPFRSFIASNTPDFSVLFDVFELLPNYGAFVAWAGPAGTNGGAPTAISSRLLPAAAIGMGNASARNASVDALTAIAQGGVGALLGDIVAGGAVSAVSDA